MFGFKSVVAAVAVTTMVGTSAFGADSAFAPGRPAGVKSAQQIGTGTLILGAGAAAIITAVAIAVSNNGNTAAPPSTFASPSTTSVAP